MKKALLLLAASFILVMGLAAASFASPRVVAYDYICDAYGGVKPVPVKLHYEERTVLEPVTYRTVRAEKVYASRTVTSRPYFYEAEPYVYETVTRSAKPAPQTVTPSCPTCVW